MSDEKKVVERVGSYYGEWVEDPKAILHVSGPQKADQVPEGVIRLLEDPNVEMVFIKRKDPETGRSKVQAHHALL